MHARIRKLALAALFFVSIAQAQSPATAPDSTITTLHSSARIVVVDVVVTDKQHHPVHDLKLSDFSLLENKVPQTLNSFAEHTPRAGNAGFPALPKLQPGIFVNDPGGPAFGPANVLLLDTLNTPVQDQIVLRQQLLDFLNKSRPSARIAIFSLTTRLTMLQDFTADPEVLRRVVKMPANVRQSQMLEDPITGNATGPKLSDRLADDGQTTASVIARLATFEATQQALKIQTRTHYTLEGLNQLARYLVGFPGRKNVIWFSGSFPITVMPDIEHTDAAIATSRPNLPTNGAGARGNPFQGVVGSEKEFRQTADLLARSQVAVYPVQVHGLASTASFDAQVGGANSPKYSRNPNAFATTQTASFTQTASDDSTMLQLADETGGRAFLNSNGLSDAVASAIDLGSSYYTLSYIPGSSSGREDYRKIQVNLEKQGYSLTYRHGYFAGSSGGNGQKDNSLPVTALEVAMEDGAPPATEIPLMVRVLPASSSLEQTVAPGNTPNPSFKGSKPPFRRLTVDYSADAHAIQFVSLPNGGRRAVLDFSICVYTPRGELANAISKRITVDLKPDGFAAMQSAGLNYYQQISVPSQGEYNLRIAIHDQLADHIGSLEIPVAAVKNLAPLASSPPAHAAAQ